METTRESDAGYPEENAAEVVADDGGPDDRSTVRESARPREAARNAPDNDDGTATGNPHAAGA